MKKSNSSLSSRIPFDADPPKQSSIKKPISFSFKFFQKQDFKRVSFLSNFLERLKLLSGMTWDEAKKTGKRRYGWEKIPTSQLKCKLPNLSGIDYIAFRVGEELKAMVGFQEGSVFNIVFIEENYNEAYNHS